MKKEILLIFFILTTSLIGADETKIKFSEIYGKNMNLSSIIKSNEGKKITIQGFMAPPLKPDANFFVLTKMPMSVCPFCENEADWPDDIILVKIKKNLELIGFNKLIEVTGILETGVEIDKVTGFVSLIRLKNAVYRISK